MCTVGGFDRRRNMLPPACLSHEHPAHHVGSDSRLPKKNGGGIPLLVRVFATQEEIYQERRCSVSSLCLKAGGYPRRTFLWVPLRHSHDGMLTWSVCFSISSLLPVLHRCIWCSQTDQRRNYLHL